ncbi:hypothetical protein MTR_0053s0040 [Medicago truncatula]|uniref:Uncharacterized protein n=1 Tax=Medicago truncatula TaxID=3880 RepID=A0A072TTY3_MEDTR|nr:hypothetical protein MTR_0053s0040 [Medicago truncatula]
MHAGTGSYRHNNAWLKEDNNDMDEKRALKEYVITSSDELYDAILYPTVEDIKFEIKPALIYLVQQNQFFRSPTEDPNFHISNLIRLSGTLKANQEAGKIEKKPLDSMFGGRFRYGKVLGTRNDYGIP